MRSHLLAAGLAGAVLTGPAALVPSSIVASAATTAAPPDRITFVVNTDTTQSAMTRVRHTVRSSGGQVLNSWRRLGVVVGVTVPGEGWKDATGIVQRLRTMPVVDSAGISGRFLPEPKPVARMNLHDRKRPVGPGPFARDARAPRANRWATGKGVTVGVADQGVFAEHVSLKGRYRPRISASCIHGQLRQGGDHGRPVLKDFTHGTAVASVIAGQPGHVMQGVAPGARIASVRVVSSEGYIYPEAAICSTMWAVENHIPILNASYGIDWAGQSPHGGAFWDPRNPNQRAVIQSVRRAFRFSTKHGVLNVAAIGNSGEDLRHKPTIPRPSSEEGQPPLRNDMLAIPQEFASVLTVAGHQPSGPVDSYSNVGLGIAKISAVSSGPLAQQPNRFQQDAGTSFAAPAVAGIAALLKQVRPHRGPHALERAIMDGARPRTCGKSAGDLLSGQPCESRGGMTSYFGAGDLDAVRSLRAVGIGA